MAKKKVTKRKSTKVSSAKRSATKKQPTAKTSKKVSKPINKKRIVLKNLIVFGILFILSSLIYTILPAGDVADIFFFLALITGVIALAFLISYVVLFFMKAFSK